MARSSTAIRWTSISSFNVCKPIVKKRGSLHAHWGAELHRCKMEEIKVADLAAMQVEEIKAE
jgi:hypothetical protein